MPSVRPKSFALELPPDKAFGGVFFLERLMYICMSVSIPVVPHKAVAEVSRIGNV